MFQRACSVAATLKTKSSQSRDRLEDLRYDQMVCFLSRMMMMINGFTHYTTRHHNHHHHILKDTARKGGKGGGNQ